MNLSQKIFFIILGILIFLNIVGLSVSNNLSSRDIDKLFVNFKTSLDHMNSDTEKIIMNLSRQSARSLLKEIRIAVGNSLKPGEADIFKYLVKQQEGIEELLEFSFYGMDGNLELSSNPDTEQTKVPDDIWEEGKSTQELVMRDNESSFSYYDPLFADRDMVRLNPGWELGTYYGMLYVKISKVRIQQAIGIQQERTADLIEAGRIDSERFIKNIRHVTIAVALLSFLVVGAVLWVLLDRNIKRPIGDAVFMAQAISRGDFTQKLEYLKADEIGVLAGALNNMVSNLEKMFGDIFESVKTLNQTSSELSGISVQLSSGAEQTATSAGTVGISAREMSSNMNSVAATMEQTSNNVSALEISVEEMISTIDEIFQNSDNARNICAGAVSQAHSASGEIEELGTATREIRNVVGTINDISDQTNLLALNATIEAARAGESGKGFAVVANEVKELARQTANATKLIEERIEGIYKSTDRSVNEIKQISEVIDNVNEIVTIITGALEKQSLTTKEISANVAQLSEGIQDININVKESSTVVNEIATDISNITSDTGEMKDVSSQVGLSSAKLSELATHFKKMADKFKV